MRAGFSELVVREIEEERGETGGEGGTLKVGRGREVSVNQSAALMFSFNPLISRWPRRKNRAWMRRGL